MKRLTSLILLVTLFISACNKSATSPSEHEVQTQSIKQTSPVQMSKENVSDPESEKTLDDHRHETITRSQESSSIRQTDSHSHGMATLAIALDNNELFIELESPLYNIVGFEHKPSSEQDHAQLQKAESLLGKPARFIVFNPDASCEPAHSQAVSLFSDDIEHGHHDNHNDHETHEDETHGDEHSEALIEYSFTCAKPDKLTSVTVELFTFFPNLTKLETVYLGPIKQEQIVLTPNNKQFNFSK